jgi:hypothetical protein
MRVVERYREEPVTNLYTSAAPCEHVDDGCQC